MDLFVFVLFCCILGVCVALNISVVYALLVGLLLFCGYARCQKHSWRALARMIGSGIWAARNILMLFLFIGMLTALWRASGCVCTIICHALRLIRPETLLLMAFLLNCFISVLTGSSFAAAATVGVICMALGTTMHASPVLMGGAVLSGAYFGDRCSPVSTSALLVANLTGTNIFDNLRNMIRTGLVPFLLCCLIYGLLGLANATAADTPELQQLFEQEFRLHWLTLTPAVLIVVLSALKVSAKTTMLCSIAAAFVVSLLVQQIPLPQILRMLLDGYHAQSPQIAVMLDGGGIRSMLSVAAIVCLSSAFAGIFDQTGLLRPVQRIIAGLRRSVGSFGAMLSVSILLTMVACSQTLGIMLTHQLCKTADEDPLDTAIGLENSAVIIAPLIPWCTASAAPLAAINAPLGALLAACFLYLQPLCYLLVSLLRRKAAHTPRNI